MTFIKLWSTFLLIPIFVTTPIFVVCETIQSRQDAAKSGSCAAAEHRQFDFWVGDWDVADFGDTKSVARVNVGLILDGCALQEDYRGINNLQGRSVSTYDASRKIWRQDWVTNQGRSFSIEGSLHDGVMVLIGEDHAEHGRTLVRRIWRPVAGGVRETAVTSIDGGKTWRPWFDLLFRRAISRSDSEDEATVAALDTIYQTAVRLKDAATIDRLLDDHFILVTGAGKVYTKADLLAEAKDAGTHYDHQEDTAQTVRVWGDTAIVTAKLWVKGTQDGKPFDKTVWFSDTYVRTAAGWRYSFAQSSLSLPPTS